MNKVGEFCNPMFEILMTYNFSFKGLVCDTLIDFINGQEWLAPYSFLFGFSQDFDCIRRGQQKNEEILHCSFWATSLPSATEDSDAWILDGSM